MPNAFEHQIEERLRAEFSPIHLQVINESHKHSGSRGLATHFKIILVSKHFSGLSHLARHRAVQNLINTQLIPDLHALSLKLCTPDEWKSVTKDELSSPPCVGSQNS